MISSLSGGAHRLFSIVLPSFALSLGACSIPRDPSGTMDRVEQSGTLRLGVIEGAEMNEASRRTLARVLDRTGSRPETQRGDSEVVLARLKKGEIDLVYGELAMDSPWSREVAFSAPQGLLAKAPKSEPVPRFAVMNGENGWLMLGSEASK